MGYQREHDPLRLDFPGVDHKRVYRLYSDANLAERMRRQPSQCTWSNITTQVTEACSMDFASDSLANGRRLKWPTMAGDLTHEAVYIAVDYGISGRYVTRLLDQAMLFRCYPTAPSTANGPALTCHGFIG